MPAINFAMRFCKCPHVFGALLPRTLLLIRRSYLLSSQNLVSFTIITFRYAAIHSGVVEILCSFCWHSTSENDLYMSSTRSATRGLANQFRYGISAVIRSISRRQNVLV